MARLFVIILVFTVVGTGIFAYFTYIGRQKTAVVTTFEECAQLYPVMESYPAQCVTPDKKHFTQNIGNELELREEILINSPRPNEIIKNPLKIQGKAKGSWFFEGSFPVQLRDGNGNTIASGVMTADGDWMSEQVVPFSGTLSFTKPETKTGILFFRNDNPSGLPENEKTLKIPITF